MQLSFKQPHLSISAFPDIELPPFSVIVGLNGSGKSHLLQAIQNGSVSNSIVAAPLGRTGRVNSNIKLLGQNDRVLDLGKAYNTAQNSVAAPANITTESFERARLRLLAPHQAALEDAANQKIEEILQPGEDVWRLGTTEVANRLGEADVGRIEAIFAAAEQALTSIDSAQKRKPRKEEIDQAQMVEVVRRVAEKISISPLQVDITQMKLFAPWGNTDQFSANLPLLFGKYRDVLLRNRLQRLEDNEQGIESAIREEDFIANFGSRPWDQINDTLAAFALPYEFTPPSLNDFATVTVKLTKVGTDKVVSPQNLSSGEKVLLQFAISSFHYDEDFISVSRPKILLLDEMDASLHPEMVNRWLRAIQHGLVEAQGLNCIITTHSPTTVALAPEESLFEMKDGSSGLAKIAKREALNKLTYGVPTLSINYTGRRQVFAESDTDAAIYESVYALIKSHICCERDLNFISTGLRDKDNGEINAGCTIVKQTVERLADLGNSSIFGIVDWDGEAHSTDRIKVVAGGERNGIENVLLDPLLMALLLMKERRLPKGFEDIDRFTGAPSLKPPELQRLIDAIQTVVFPYETERVEVSYLSGAKSEVLRAYLRADDHELEDNLAEKFPVLKKWKNRGRGELVKAVIEHVLSEHSLFCPVALPKVFEAIANAAT
ncbi:AAA family ATPase [uncultured Roseibium sp.]|uniref:AAA family ATPase n=1 Tax=uncultured Roseibium sp. TaxID=1936171 RepID=UPI0026065C89|nr:AAA family ATPase [uncultured Roseibium sp.]